MKKKSQLGQNWWRRLCNWGRLWQRVQREQATEKLQWEVAELEHIFALLVLGSYVGLPSPPPAVTLELLPYMEQDLKRMEKRVQTASDPLAELFSLLEID